VVGALSKYAMALSFIPEDMLMQLQGFHEEVAWNVKLPILLNMSACHLKLQDWEHAIQCCDQALDHDADNAKALFRRGCAKQSLGQTEAARKDLESAASRAPNDSAIKKHLQALCREEKATRKATAHMFRGAFRAPQEAAPSGAQTSTQSQGDSMIQRMIAMLRGWMNFFLGFLPSWIPRVF